MNGNSNQPMNASPQSIDNQYQQQYQQYPQYQNQQLFQQLPNPMSTQQNGQFYEQQPSAINPQQAPQQIDMVYIKNLIEQYLQYYYTYQQIIFELEKKGISKDATTVVLQALISQNKDYFTAYEIRVNLNDQIDRFNKFIRRYFQVSAQQQVIQQQPQQQILTQPQPPQVLQQGQQQVQQPGLQLGSSDMSGEFANSFISSFQGDQSMGM
ncbi:hypothetical protein EHI8A_228580 [Entamoeba histolytica HM-1:IMSS-B]|uniref:Uncharacterized protein n=5 Tax=Entamoeba histolytica TaxID=5759 RepID=C4M3Q8_ENTH1|nr:hypothetical protein EHI_146150 [Entamoeba histolytica HM-1:IMSS]EMH74545.1 hypothetical protein EHI8A_228580 [Entamoeba histolytica HM-1:IMSS-B]EMS13973.1 hypothetical protein KM1_295300 [Entamoeba histolytica HM-3:IMSS]ENY60703.1 hypothetical protein EHI7A_194410 [Entamoeba histolytica HM-1:IMSS-A]GAT95964.1 hypothetical protein CL6EHI_146150 [Entamoeba histolytica]EAL47919.1 hypothetical protein EHI_146150 [Entamoeba histolytica HM-1:IMSS]|eukprot:XP_653305.1 hypothetical protein EHI_146150 [Entamoeba histolytica HM-1:IMSS]